MNTETVTETCACGARFVWSGWRCDSANRLREFREGHQHVAESVGICGDKAQPLVFGDVEIDPAWCCLQAGHAGMHDGGDGRHWTKPGPLAAEQDSRGATGHHDDTGAQRGDSAKGDA